MGEERTRQVVRAEGTDHWAFNGTSIEGGTVYIHGMMGAWRLARRPSLDTPECDQGETTRRKEETRSWTPRGRRCFEDPRQCSPTWLRVDLTRVLRAFRQDFQADSATTFVKLKRIIRTVATGRGCNPYAQKKKTHVRVLMLGSHTWCITGHGGGHELGGGCVECNREQDMGAILGLMNLMKECGRDPKWADLNRQLCPHMDQAIDKGAAR